MNQDEFLAKLFSLYATTFNRGNGQAWSEAYKQVLKPNIDYDALYDYMLANYAGVSAPSPAFLLKNATYINTEEPENIPVTDTVIVKKGLYEYEYGVKSTEYSKAADYFKREGFTVIKVKYCDKNCMRCGFNHVCTTAKELKV